MPYYVNGSEMKRIIPGTFPRFEHVWSITKGSYDTSTITEFFKEFTKKEKISAVSASELRFKKSSTDLRITQNSKELIYTANDFSDSCLPK